MIEAFQGVTINDIYVSFNESSRMKPDMFAFNKYITA